jgi:HSP20 family protein
MDFFKKAFGDPNEFFKNIDLDKLINSNQFKKMYKDFYDQMIRNLPKNMQNLSPEELMKEMMKNPIIYGFKVGVGKNGPVINSFGNVKKERYSGKPKVEETREPLTEVNEQEDQIVVIAEMPGVTKEDISLKATNRTLTISTQEGVSARTYFKEIDLPAAVNSDFAKARYTNGILEVKLKKISEKHTKIKID